MSLRKAIIIMQNHQSIVTFNGLVRYLATICSSRQFLTLTFTLLTLLEIKNP